jgi:uncharacterized protein (TIGR00369 family)
MKSRSALSEPRDEAKTSAASHVRLSIMMSPEHANPHGNVHGGIIMRLIDEAGALAAMRHARAQVVTVVVDTITFIEPIYVGNVVTLDAEVTYTGRTSMETRVEVMAEDPITGARTFTNTAYLVYVALDPRRQPTPVPPLMITSPEEQAEWDAAAERQAYRKQQRVKEAARKGNA